MIQGEFDNSVASAWRVGLERERECDPHWRAAVEALAPRGESLSWYHVAWDAGDVWQPIERWTVFQMVPWWKAPDVVRTELRGPHPRSTGHYCAQGECRCKVKRNRWVDGAAKFVDRLTYELAQTTGGYGQRLWIVQGSHGGHKYRLNPVEAKVARLNSGVSDTPAPGDLPYADVDARVIAKLLPLDQVRFWTKAIRFSERHPDELDADEAALMQDFRRSLWSWLDDQLIEPAHEMRSAKAREAMRALPQPAGHKDTTNYEREEEEFITEPA